MSNSTPARARALKTTAVLGLAALAVTGCRSTVGTSPTAGGTKTTASPAPSSSAPSVDATPSASASHVASTEASASIDPNHAVVFNCSPENPAPEGVTLTYGPAGSPMTATELPFTATLPLDDAAPSYSMSIALHGYGDARCTVTVTYGDDGRLASSVGEAVGTDATTTVTVTKSGSGYLGNQ